MTMRPAETQGGKRPASASAFLAPGVALLQPKEQVLEAMLAGWEAQQASRLLSRRPCRSKNGS